MNNRRKIMVKLYNIAFGFLIAAGAISVLFFMLGLLKYNNADLSLSLKFFETAVACTFICMVSFAVFILFWAINGIGEFIHIKRTIKSLDDDNINRLDKIETSTESDSKSFIRQMRMIDSVYQSYGETNNLSALNATMTDEDSGIGKLYARADLLRSRRSGFENSISSLIAIFVSLVTSYAVTISMNAVKNIYIEAVEETQVSTENIAGILNDGMYRMINVVTILVIIIGTFAIFLVYFNMKKRGRAGSLNYLVRDYELDVINDILKNMGRNMKVKKGNEDYLFTQGYIVNQLLRKKRKSNFHYKKQEEITKDIEGVASLNVEIEDDSEYTEGELILDGKQKCFLAFSTKSENEYDIIVFANIQHRELYEYMKKYFKVEGPYLVGKNDTKTKI